MSQEKFKLVIELVPSTVWFSSLHNMYMERGQRSKWKKIKKELFAKEGEQCWVCGGKGGRLEAHEFWKYDDKNHVQKLVSVHHLCDMCHRIKHIGFWCHTEEGREKLARLGVSREDLANHFCRVNNCSIEEFEEHEVEAFQLWEKRSKYEWVQDFGQYGPDIKVA